MFHCLTGTKKSNILSSSARGGGVGWTASMKSQRGGVEVR